MSSTMARSRTYAGSAILNGGYRPFFLSAALWAVLAMARWIGAPTGRFDLSGPLQPLDWHVHELLFGYLGAAVAGFLLTAVPNCTGAAWR